MSEIQIVAFEKDKVIEYEGTHSTSLLTLEQ